MQADVVPTPGPKVRANECPALSSPPKLLPRIAAALPPTQRTWTESRRLLRAVRSPCSFRHHLPRRRSIAEQDLPERSCLTKFFHLARLFGKMGLQQGRSAPGRKNQPMRVSRPPAANGNADTSPRKIIIRVTAADLTEALRGRLLYFGAIGGRKRNSLILAGYQRVVTFRLSCLRLCSLRHLITRHSQIAGITRTARNRSASISVFCSTSARVWHQDFPDFRLPNALAYVF